MLKYIEFCAGIGGMRAGLTAAGWKCVLAVDNDEDAVSVHRLAHGDATLADVTELKAESLPEADVWVAGFPCQPFSTSGSRLGFVHRSGHVFESLARLISVRRPRLVVLENVEGLLSNKSGHTFAVILSTLTALGYRADWLVVDLSWFGVPQTRPRLFVVAAREGVLNVSELPDEESWLPGLRDVVGSTFVALLREKDLTHRERGRGSLRETEKLLAPAIGKARYAGPRLFHSLGHAEGDRYVSLECVGRGDAGGGSNLGEIVAPRFREPRAIRSGRFYARGGPTKLCLRDEGLSHCVGTSLGGAPLYAVPIASVRSEQARAAFLEFSNWSREQDGYLVMRLGPDRAVLLFGPHTESLYRAVQEWDAGETRKYVLVGNMVAPVCAMTVAALVERQWLGNGDARSERRAATPGVPSKALRRRPARPRRSGPGSSFPEGGV